MTTVLVRKLGTDNSWSVLGAGTASVSGPVAVGDEDVTNGPRLPERATVRWPHRSV